MGAVAAGAHLFIAAVVAVFAAAYVPGFALVMETLARVVGLAAVVCFFLGFAPPSWLRRAWREPDLRSFLERSVHLSGVGDDRALIGELQRAAADTLGTPGAALGLADALGERLTYLGPEGDLVTYPSDLFVGGRAFTEQRRLVVSDTTVADPEQSDVYLRSNARVAIAVPVTADNRRLGVLVAYGDRAIFVEDDLSLVQLLADQAAVILEARRVAREASELRGREEATTLKEEFLSAAAHDLRTPLTVLLGQAELIERRLQRDPNAAVDSAGISRIVRESRRLRELVSQLLDAQRLEDVGPDEDQDPIDVREVALSCLDRFTTNERPIAADLGTEPILVKIERMRLEQVLDNLLQNAAKYAAGGPPTEVRTWREGAEARIAVIDHGIGIPAAERGRVFERFFRASNAQARSDTGLGLGLHICRRIVEGHGGRISIEETPGGGSTFHVALPTEVRSANVDTAGAVDVRLAGAAEARSDG
jgi:signal transduction histidine kinase